MNKQRFVASFMAAVLLVAGILTAVLQQTTYAIDAQKFNAGRIIDDSIFYDSSFMSTSQVQSFLNSKVPTCDTNGTQNKSYYYTTATGEVNNADGKSDGDQWVTTSRATYGSRYDKWYKTTIAATPFTCLKDYSQKTPAMPAVSSICGNLPSHSSRTAAQIITDAAAACGVNPAVLVVLLQKEQSLVTDDWPWDNEYTKATGFGCPDTQACDSSYAGFFYQVYSAAYQFKNYKANPNNYNYVAGQNNTIYYNPGPYDSAHDKYYGNAYKVNGVIKYGSQYASQGTSAPDITYCGSKTVYIQNQATAGLYDYTPYLPNDAALSAGYGTGDKCSSYGNRNFFLYFGDWFGDPTYVVKGSIGTKYKQLGGETGPLGSPLMDEKCGLIHSGCYQKFEHGSIYWTSKTGAWSSQGDIHARWGDVGYQNGRLGYPTSDEISLSTGGKYQQFQGGRIYWKSGIGAWDVAGSIGSRYVQTHADEGALGYPTGAEVTVSSGTKYQQFQGGRIYWQKSRGTYSVYGDIGARYMGLKADKSRLGLPLSNEITLSTGGKYQKFEHGRIYWKKATGAWDVGGSIGDRYYNQLDADASALLYPTSGEISLPGGGKYQNFEGGRIYWKSKLGANSVYGSIGQRYLTISADESRLGLPTSNEVSLSSGGVYQQFEHGRIYWNHGVGAFDVGGSIQARYLKIHGDVSRLGYPTSEEISLPSGGKYQSFEKGRIYWKSKLGAFDVAGSIGAKYVSLGADTSALGYPKSAEVKKSNGAITQQYEHGSITYQNKHTTYKVS